MWSESHGWPISRRHVILSGASFGLVNFYSGWQRSMIANSEVLGASVMYVDFAARRAFRNGLQVPYVGTVVGDGSVLPGGSNLLSPYLPFTGTSLHLGRLPSGLEWHGATSPKTLISTTPDGVRFRGHTSKRSLKYMGGVRTSEEVVKQGETVLMGFKANISEVLGDDNVSIRASLLRTHDGSSTLLERVYNQQEESGITSVVSLHAPVGGLGDYKLVFTGEAGREGDNQSAVFDISDIVVIPAPSGVHEYSRYSVPPYFRSTIPDRDVIVSTSCPTGNYFVLLRTEEFGWGAETVFIDRNPAQISLRKLFGSSIAIDAKELVLIPEGAWKRGWMSRLGSSAWTPLRYMNVEGTRRRSRPESPNRLSRATGLLAGSSAIASDRTNNLPHLDAPQETWAASYDSNVKSYLAFKADQAKYIGETTIPSGVRSEVCFTRSVDFEKSVWTSFWFRCLTTLYDPKYERKCLLMQFRYTKNLEGDASALSPELSLEQWPHNRFALIYRTDGGHPVLSGAGEPEGVHRKVVGPWTGARAVWNRIVIRSDFSNAGGGYLGVWLNGRQLTNGPARIGYCRDNGPKLRFGAYKFSDYPSRVEFQHFEHGYTDLSHRIGFPLPV